MTTSWSSSQPHSVARKHKQIFFRALSGDEVWAVDFRTDNAFVPGKPYLLFHRPGLGADLRSWCWDVALDDQRFLLVTRAKTEPTPVTEMILVQNWFEELKRLVPVGEK